MAAGYSDQFLEQGTSFNSSMTLTDAYGNPYNLTGCTISSQAKKSYYSSNVFINFVTTIANPLTGQITLSLSPSATANVPAGKLVYDVTMSDGQGNISRVLEGQIIVSPGVTNISTAYGSQA